MTVIDQGGFFQATHVNYLIFSAHHI